MPPSSPGSDDTPLADEDRFDPTTMDPRDIATLRAIMAALRTPVTGCPWDLEQDFASIAPYTIEEAYEVADAISRGYRAELCDELGDLLLQPVYHAQMAAEEGSFTFDDVVEGVVRKMIRRHPHVFGDDEGALRRCGQGLLGGQQGEGTCRSGKTAERLLAGVPLALPGLTRAHKLQAKAAKVGFDWPHVDHVYDKIAEELEELKEAAAGETRPRNWATCSSSWPISPVTMGSIRRPPCAVRTRSSSAASPTLKTS